MVEDVLILNKINGLLRNIFRDKTINADYNLLLENIEGWDSLHHSLFIYSIEKEFDIKFKLEEILEFTTIGSICSLISEKMKMQQ